MTITFEEKLRYRDLSSDRIDELVESVKNYIKGNEDIMKEIKEFCEEENKDSVEGKLSMKDYIDLKIDEMANDAVDKIRIYCSFDLEVSI